MLTSVSVYHVETLILLTTPKGHSKSRSHDEHSPHAGYHIM